MSSRQQVKFLPCNVHIFRPFHPFNVQVTEQYPSVWFLLFLSGLAKVESSRYISCSIQVLSSRIHQMNHVSCNKKWVSLVRFVMNHSCIRTSSAGCDKTWWFEELVFWSHFVHVQSAIPLCDCLLFWSPCPKFSHRNTISDVRLSKSFNFFLIPYSSVKSDTLSPLNRINKLGVNVMIDYRFLN